MKETAGFRILSQTSPSVVLLIHGFCETMDVWGPFADQLSKHHTVVLTNLPGFGGQPLPLSGFDLIHVADLLMEGYSALELGKPVVLGHSLGGYVTLAMASKYENQLNGIGLLHSTIYPDTPEKQRNRDKVIEFVANHGVEPFAREFARALFADPSDQRISLHEQMAASTPAETVMAYARAMRDRPDRSEDWKQYNIPRLLVAGGKDGIIPLEVSRTMAPRGKRDLFAELQEAGHMGFVESASECVDHVLDFLAK